MKSILVNYRHGKILVNPRDTVISRSLITYGEFAEQEIMLLSHFLKDGYSVIDVGANIGTHTIFFAKKVGILGSVLAIEPQTKICNLLCENLNLNGLKNVKVLNAALGAEAKDVPLPPIDYNQEGNFGAFSFMVENIDHYLPITKTEKSQKLAMIPLDQLPIDACNLIKVDSEKMEKSILEGASKTIRKFRPILYLENNDKGCSRGLLKYLEDLDYNIYWHVISYFREKNFSNYESNIFESPLELNIICIPKEVRINIENLPKSHNHNQWLPDEIEKKIFNLDELLEVSESFN